MVRRNVIWPASILRLVSHPASTPPPILINGEIGSRQPWRRCSNDLAAQVYLFMFCGLGILFAQWTGLQMMWLAPKMHWCATSNTTNRNAMSALPGEFSCSGSCGS